jgi:hypothetical protein
MFLLINCRSWQNLQKWFQVRYLQVYTNWIETSMLYVKRAFTGETVFYVPSILLFVTCKGRRRIVFFFLFFSFLVGRKIVIRGLNETVYIPSSLDRGLLFDEISWLKGIENPGAQLGYQILRPWIVKSS